ncbi:MAG: transposase [Planctomycetota bacterium]|nr:transposase [Planctomycetota bacterium]
MVQGHLQADAFRSYDAVFLTPDSRIVEVDIRGLSGQPATDRRLLSHENGEVRFWGKSYRKGGKRQILRLSGVEFVRRWMVHVLPPAFVRVRYYEVLANTQRRV